MFSIPPERWVSALDLLGLSAGWYDEPEGAVGAVCAYLFQTSRDAVHAQVTAAFQTVRPEVQEQVSTLLVPSYMLPELYQILRTAFTTLSTSSSLFFTLRPTTETKQFLTAAFPEHAFDSSGEMTILASREAEFDRGVWTHRLAWDDTQPITVKTKLSAQLFRGYALMSVFSFSNQNHFIARGFSLWFDRLRNYPSTHDFGTIVKSPMKLSDLEPEYAFFVSLPMPWLHLGTEWSGGFLDRKLARCKGEPVRPPGSSLMVDGRLRTSLTPGTPVTVLIQGAGYPWSYCCSGKGSLRARVSKCDGPLSSLEVEVESDPFGLSRILVGSTHNTHGDLSGTVTLSRTANPRLPQHDDDKNSVTSVWHRTRLFISINRDSDGFKDVTDYVASLQFVADVFFRNEFGPPSDVELYKVQSVEDYIQSKMENKLVERRAKKERVHKNPHKPSDWSDLKRVVDGMRDKQPPEVCWRISKGIRHYKTTSCGGDPGCQAAKTEFEQARLQHDAACFRVAEPDDVQEAVALLGDTLYRGFGGFFDLLPSNPITAATAGWSYNNEKYVTFDFTKAASYANLIGTSEHVKTEWSCIVKLFTERLASNGQFKQGVVYDRYRESVGTQMTMDKRLKSLYDAKRHFVRVVRRIFPDEKATKIEDLVGLLRGRLVMAVGQDQIPRLHKAAASLVMFEEAVWTPAVAAPDNAFASAILETRIYHASFMPRVQKKDKRRGRADRPLGIDAGTPHFLLRDGVIQPVGLDTALTPEAATILQNKLISELTSIGLQVAQTA